VDHLGALNARVLGVAEDGHEVWLRAHFGGELQHAVLLHRELAQLHVDLGADAHGRYSPQPALEVLGLLMG